MVAIVALSACAVGPDFVRPSTPVADRYTTEPLAPVTVIADGQAQRFHPGAPQTPDWWRIFHSSALDAVVRQAISASPTLEQAGASLRQSQDKLRAGYGVFFPQVDAGLDATRERAAPVPGAARASGSAFNVVTLGGTIGYALDVFGSGRRTVEGLQAEVDFQRNASRSAYLALTANVVNACIARAAYAAQARATAELIELEQEQLQGTQAQATAGIASYSSVLAIRAQLAQNRALLAPLQQSVSRAEHLLAVLEGTTSPAAALPDIEFSDLALPVDLPVSLPSALARDRPDILQAEAQLHLASADVGVATAALFPSVTLDGSYGSAGSGLGTLLSASGRFWSIGPSVSIPIFRGGTLWYGRMAAQEAYRASEANYRQVVLLAFAQVADVLNALEHDAQGLQALDDARRDSGAALRLLQASYGAGMVAYLDVLVADVQFHQASISYLQARAQREQDSVALYAALGGGWWNEARPQEPVEPK